eukprot:TRINITY_DN1553_c0_g1_i1.p1 TRINITY_DN1553_c0_g1~~TRINITY_DN1553_c0_g1_i1.p1  ORF type:complete len:538 (-),score=65.54 TRINITY_DN1553_c0_g1_i1:467-2080(-)
MLLYPLNSKGTTITGNRVVCTSRQIVFHVRNELYHKKQGNLQILTRKFSRQKNKAIFRVRSEGDGDVRDPRKLIKREIELKSNKLDQKVRQAVEVAVEECGYAVGVGQVASKSGVSVSQTEEALNAFVADTGGALRVSSVGEIQYALSPDFRNKLRNKSILIKLEPVAKVASDVAAWLIRVMFGTALLVSITIAFTALLVLATSSDRDNNNRRESRGGGGFFPMRMGLDWWWFWDPYYDRRRARVYEEKDPDEMGFFQAVFSVVFGDGDPNLDVESMRWQLLGNFIKSKGGVVTAEQLAPFSDPPPEYLRNRNEAFNDESFVVPALLRFGGHPEVNENGNILYVFPSMGVEWERQNRGGFYSLFQGRGKRQQLIDVPGTEVNGQAELVPSDSMVVEQEWKQTKANLAYRIGVGFLLMLNAVGIGLLSFYARDPQAIRILSQNGFQWLPSLLPALQTYAVSLFAIPLYRWFRNKQRNKQIRERNQTRFENYWLLNRPDQELKTKLQSAEKLSKQKKQIAGDIVYTTEKDLLEQPETIS